MLIDTTEGFHEVLRWMRGQEDIGIDTETTGLNSFKGNRIAGVSLAAKDGASFYLPFRHGNGQNLDIELLPELTAAMNLHINRFIYWNAKFDLLMFHHDGYVLPPTCHPKDRVRVEDAMIAAHLVNENEPNYQLKATADRYGIGRGSLDEEELRTVVMNRFRCTNGHGAGEKCDLSCKKITVNTWKGQMWRLEPKIVAAYAETDAILTLALREFYLPHLKTWKLDDLYPEVCEYLLTLTRMEIRGVQLDVERIRANQAEALEKKAELLAHFRTITGKRDFNPGSWQQLQAAFGWPTTKEDYLKQLEAAGDPHAAKVLEYRAWDKVNSTYYDVWLSSMDGEYKLRTNMNIIGTNTGRLASREPNLQAIPKKDAKQAHVYKVKDTIISSSPDMTLLEIDIAGAELRLACHYANETVMGALLARNEDIHTATSVALGIPRPVAKTVNFSAVYGIGANKFAATYHHTLEDSKRYLAAYHGRYKGFKRLYYGMQDVADTKGYIRLQTGRIRRYRVGGRAVAEAHKASSNYIQGTVGEVMRITMYRLAYAMQGRQAHMLLTIHDSLLLEVPKSEAMYWACLAAKAMTDFGFDPPLNVECKIGDRWGDMETLELPEWSYWRPTKYIPSAVKPEGEPDGFCWWQVEAVEEEEDELVA